jgi:hypothetical protein
MAITALLFYFAMKLRSPGEVYTLGDAVGVQAEVYLTIPSGGGVGRIRFSVNGAKHEAGAVSETGDVIKSFEMVTVTRLIDAHTVAVRK